MSNSGLGLYENKSAEIESIISLFNDPVLQSRINAILEANVFFIKYIPTTNPTLRLELESNEVNYELNLEDLQAVKIISYLNNLVKSRSSCFPIVWHFYISKQFILPTLRCNALIILISFL